MARPSHIGQAAEKGTMASLDVTGGVLHEGVPAMSARTPDAEPLLTPAEVATMFRVDPKTVTRWAKAGKLTSIRTLGGHRRYRESEVRALLAGIPSQRADG
jgi:excisionase family DNA binding protein